MAPLSQKKGRVARRWAIGPRGGRSGSTPSAITQLIRSKIGYLAFEEWLFSKTLERQMKRFLVYECTTLKALQGGTATNPTTRRRFPWTQVHSYYAMMGGYCLDTSGLKINFLPDGRRSMTLTPRALLKLTELEPDMIPVMMPDHSKDTIEDKSKADGLAKMIVCIQAHC